MLEATVRTTGEKGLGKSSKGREQWYCKDYNKGECSHDAPHAADVCGKRRQVKHFCAKCWGGDHELRSHAEVDEECPHRQ